MTRRSKIKPSRSHEEATIESFRKDPFFAAEFLNAVLEDGDQEELMLALRRMSKAFGGVTKLASKSKLNPNTLYRTLSPRGRPRTQEPQSFIECHGNAVDGSPAGAETCCVISSFPPLFNFCPCLASLATGFC